MNKEETTQQSTSDIQPTQPTDEQELKKIIEVEVLDI